MQEILANMKAKLDASRCLLYETARYVDLYKAYEDIARERSLTPDERKEMKLYNKFADACTPLAKGLTSEYCNQNAYDCIQIHGGSGFMKDYACERVYRDARITSIYEGTTQLQVVAAIRHVMTGTYSQLVAEYAQMEISDELQAQKTIVEGLFRQYEDAVKHVHEVNNPEYTDFMARHLVEMAGDVVMSYLLMTDATRYNSASLTRSAKVYVNLAAANVAKNAAIISSVTPETMAVYNA